MHRFDKYWIGIVLGLLLPAVFGYLYLDSMGLWQALSSLGDMAKGILALIFLFYTTDTWKLSKGILIGALPYIIGTLIISM